MHELTLLTGLMKKIESLAKENDAERVTRVSVILGALSHISPGHFREHFKHAARGTVAEHAELDVVKKNDENDPLATEIILESVELDDGC